MNGEWYYFDSDG
ncbi:hypothetical protein DIC82_11870 [Clostridium beijerinckii]|nr:hypothetical protein DIC82_11870 [Clostridium beijerinckii]